MGWDDRKDKVCYNQLPEQIREYYGEMHIFGDIWLAETWLVMEFYPGEDRDEKHTDVWDKTPDGNWHRTTRPRTSNWNLAKEE